MKVLSSTSILKSSNNAVNMYEGSPNLYQFELMHMSCLVFIYDLIKEELFTQEKGRGLLVDIHH